MWIFHCPGVGASDPPTHGVQGSVVYEFESLRVGVNACGGVSVPQCEHVESMDECKSTYG